MVPFTHLCHCETHPTLTADQYLDVDSSNTYKFFQKRKESTFSSRTECKIGETSEIHTLGGKTGGYLVPKAARQQESRIKMHEDRGVGVRVSTRGGVLRSHSAADVFANNCTSVQGFIVLLIQDSDSRFVLNLV